MDGRYKMIKIIKPGKIKVAVCPRCECKFSYEREDVKYGDQRDYYEEVSCPCCDYAIDLLYKKCEVEEDVDK